MSRLKSMRKRKFYDDRQLSLFDVEKPAESWTETPAERVYTEPSPIELIRARFEKSTDMSPEDYKKWIKFLVNWSVRDK